MNIDKETQCFMDFKWVDLIKYQTILNKTAELGKEKKKKKNEKEKKPAQGIHIHSQLLNA